MEKRPSDHTAAVTDAERTFEELSDEYTIRWYGDDDRAAFMDLFELGFSDRHPDWFAWKYEGTPYSDRVPVIVAEKDGAVAAIRPFMPLDLQVGDQRLPVLMPVDLVVHPDHRRKGLMTTLTRSMKSGLWDDYAATFTFANTASRDGIVKMTDERWPTYDLGEYVKYERINNPAAFFANESRPRRVAAEALTPLYRARNHLRDRLVDDDAAVTIARFDDVPTSLLVDLYERAPPTVPHVARDEEFYGWRFDEPGWSFVTYVAHRDETPVAAVVVGSRTGETAISKAYLFEILPLVSEAADAAVFSSLLGRIKTDYASVDQLCAAAGSIPDAVFAAHGFARSDALPFSKLVDPAYLVVSVLGNSPDPETTARLCGDGDAVWETPVCVRLLG
jgi:GNAT superfamily N-acetyltransferase